MVKRRFMLINNVNIFDKYESLLQKIIRVYRQITKTKQKFQEKVASSGFSCKKK